MEHKSYLIISKTHSGIHKQSSLSSLLFKRNFMPKELISLEVHEEFKKSLNRVVTVLNESPYFDLKKLSIEETISLVNNYENLSFGENEFTSNIFQDNNKSKIGNKFINALAVNSLDCLPNNYDNIYSDTRYSSAKTDLSFSFFHPIGLGLNVDHIVNQVFIKTSKEAVKESLKKIDAMNRTFMAADPTNILNLNDSEEFGTIIEKGVNPINYHANVLIWDTSQSELDNKINLAFTAFNKMKVLPNLGHNEILPLYWSSYPGNAADIGFIDQTFLLQDIEASALNIYESNNKSHNSEFGLLLNDRINGCPLFVDVSDLPMKMGLTNNRNKMIIGPSGSGKSFFTNHMTNNYLNYDTHVVIVDIGHSYERLCELRNGKYLTYEEGSPISFNPFHIIKEDINIEKKESLVTLIFTLWKKNPGDATKDEDSIIRDGLNKYYDYVEENKLKMCFNSYFDFMQDIFFPSLNEKTAELIKSSSFTNVLKQFYKGGEYDYLLNSEINIDLIKEKFIVFELDNIKGHQILFPVVTLMIMDTFITKMRLLKTERKVILIEEAWKAITKNGMAEFMKYLYKTVRKHFGEAIIVTQELDDIIGNDMIKDTIVKNCGAKILLDMRDYAANFDEIQSLLSLSEKAKEQVLSLNLNLLPGKKYKEVFIALGNEGQVYGVDLSKQEYATYTTEKREKTQIEEYKKKFGSLEMAIEEFASQMN